MEAEGILDGRRVGRQIQPITKKVGTDCPGGKAQKSSHMTSRDGPQYPIQYEIGLVTVWQRKRLFL